MSNYVPVKKYVLDNIEVVHTGRVANKKLKNNKNVQLIEVKPFLSTVGTWTKWIKETDLYEIEEEK